MSIDRRAYRPVTALAVLALVATLLIALPTALPRVAGGVSLAPAAAAVPPVDKPLPPCGTDEDGDPEPWCDRQWTSVSPCPDPEGVVTGSFCDVPGSSIGIVVSGDVGAGSTYQVTAVPGLPACADHDQTGCYEDINSHGHSGTCVWWEGEEIRSTSFRCIRHMIDTATFDGVDFVGTATERPSGWGLTTDGCGHNYNEALGNGGAVINPHWGENGWEFDGTPGYPELAAQALTCTVQSQLTVIDQLPGPFWLTAVVSLSERVGGGLPNRTHYATALIPVVGDLRDSGPQAQFEYEQLGSDSGTYSFTSTSYHPAGEAMTYAWRAEWWGPGGAYELQEDTGPSALFTFDQPGWWEIQLEVTDTDGETDSAFDSVRMPGVRASFDIEELEEHGAFQFTDRSTTFGDRVIESWEWDFGDDSTADEQSPNHTYDEPGTYDVSLTVTDDTDETATATAQVEVAAAELDGEWLRLDAASEGVKVDETAPVRLRVDNGTGSVLTAVELVSATVSGTGDAPGTAVLARATTEHEGQDAILHLPEVLDAEGPGSAGFEDFTLEGVTEGDVVLRAVVRGEDATGEIVEGTIEEEWVVRATDLTIDIVFDPPEKVQEESDESEAPPEPVEMTATVTMTNTSGGTLSEVSVEEFEVTRVIGEQQLWLEQVGGQRLTNWDAPGILLEAPTGTDVPLEPFELQDGEQKVFTADFIARDDGQLDFHVLALAADEADRTVRGYGEASWVVTPEKYLEVTTEVVIPEAGELLKAGEAVVVTGRVINLSQTAELELGPLLPVPEGNTGLMSLAYGGGRAPDPDELNPVPTLTLGPGDSELFELAVRTNYSDPRIRFEDGEPVSQPSGGTRAYLEFDPWAVATEADGTVRTVRTDPQTDEDRGVKLAEEHAEHTVSIDDTIPIPETDHVLLAGAITAGTLIGVKNAAVGLLYGVVDAVKLPYTILRGSYEYQSQVWDSFTEEERALFAEETSFLIVSILKRNVELGLQDGEALLEQVNQTVYEKMTGLATEWETGDYLTTAEVYASGAGEVIGSVALPVAMARLAQTPRAVAALTRAQQAINARMLPILDRARQIRYVEDALPLLRALENGAELTADQMRALGGITPEELSELQRLANQYDVLLTFRSRHQSSIQWIKKFGAMMKPEAIKIKSVSELDVKLGYREGDLGSVVFKKPEPLKRLPDGASKEAVEEASRAFVQERGFSPGTAEYDDAVKRMAKRVKEWDKHAGEYRTADRRKWLETEFNYDGNAIPGQQANKFPKDRTGFKLEETGRGDEWVVKLQDPKDGRYKRITGDIDPIAFTNLDGSPLTGEQHKALMDSMRESALLRAQHPESATFKYGPDIAGTQEEFILSQFKPGEPGFQIGPNGPARVVRLDPDRSRWENPRDYNLHWEGGYVHVGGRQKIAPAKDVQPDFGRDTTTDVPDKLKPKPFELGETGETTFGRATIQGVATGTGTAVFVGEAGELVEVLPDGTTRPYEGGPALLEEGEPVTLQIAPAGEVESTVGGDVQGASLHAGQFRRQAYVAAESAPQVDGVLLVDDGAPVLFAPGQVVAVGVQDGQGELRTIGSVAGRELRFTEPVAAAPDDIVVMLQPAPRASGSGGGAASPPATQPLDPACPAGMPAPAFTDLGATHARAVACAAGWSLVEGYDATTFGTGDTLTRGQLFSVLARLLAHLDVDLPTTVPDAFSDDDGTTHEDAADLLAGLGLAEGFGDGNVGLPTPVTRAQLASLLARIAGLAGDDLPDGLARFADLDASVHRDAIEQLAAAGILAGYDDTRYGPTDSLTRGQTATIVMRYLARLVAIDRATLPAL